MLLLGDATYDFKNYYGLNVENHVPPLMLETRYLQTVSDPTYAAVNGDDRLPDVAIGRLPAASVDEVSTMVEKILAYETGGASLGATIALVSDNQDGAGDFDADAEELVATVPASNTPRHISLEELGVVATRQAGSMKGRRWSATSAMAGFKSGPTNRFSIARAWSRCRPSPNSRWF